MSHQNLEGNQENNFLNENMAMSFTFTNEARGYLPDITPEELKTQREKYRGLLGTWEIEGNNALVNVKGVIENPQGNMYSEGTEEISSVNINELKRVAGEVQKISPEYANCELVGEVHTHPVVAEELDSSQNPWDYSPEDLEAILLHYKQGELNPNRPFIFGIAGPEKNGKTHYAFYRIIKTGDDYKVVKINELTKEA